MSATDTSAGEGRDGAGAPGGAATSFAAAADAAATAPASSSGRRLAALFGSDPFALAGRGVPGLDGLRGLACLMIFNVHFFAQFADVNYFTQPGSLAHTAMRALNSGSHGVDVFFVVSGFLIYGSITRKRRGFLTFLAERYKRLLPVVLVINIPALYWMNANIKEIIDNLFFLDIFGSRLVTFVSWALVYEMYFYLLCGAWLILAGRGKNGPPWPSFLALFALYVANSLYFHVTPVLSDWRFVGFFVGLLLAMLRADERTRVMIARVPAVMQPVGLVALIAACWLWSKDAAGGLSAVSPALALGYYLTLDLVVAILIASFLNAPGGFFAWTPLRAVGAVSYSLFLLHTQWGLPLANSLFGRPGSAAAMALHWCSSLAVSFALAWFLYAHLERFYFTRR